MKIKLKYPKFTLLLIIYLITLYFGHNREISLNLHNFLLNFREIGIFLAGFFYAYGFTAAPATATLLIIAEQQNIILTGLIGGLGALTGDVIIFQFIRHSFTNEIKKLKNEKIFASIGEIKNKIFVSFEKYFIPVASSILIASPLPTEVGVALLASVKNISLKKFMPIAYTLHTIGIFIILLIGINS